MTLRVQIRGRKQHRRWSGDRKRCSLVVESEGNGDTMIRMADRSDEPEIRACATHAFARYVPLIGRKPPPMTADFATQIAAGEVHVATDDQGRILGYIVFRAEKGYVLLENVGVLPDAAGQGVGKALIRFCEDTTRARGLDAVHLYTHEKMTDNISIYRSLGYVEVGRRAEDGLDRVFFEKTLA